MPTFRPCAILSLCPSFALLIILLHVFLFTAQPANSSALDESFVPPMKEYAYAPISDTMLRSLLGYNANKKQRYFRPVRILLTARPSDGTRMESDKRGNERIVMEKRKNAELVNHILKNFASLNRLGDAGRK